MTATTVTSEATAKSLYALIGGGNNYCQQVLLQALDADIYYGDNAQQPLSILLGQTISLNVTDLRSLFLKGVGHVGVIVN